MDRDGLRGSDAFHVAQIQPVPEPREIGLHVVGQHGRREQHALHGVRVVRVPEAVDGRLLKLQRAGTLPGAVLFASPIDYDRHTHYPGGRKES